MIIIYIIIGCTIASLIIKIIKAIDRSNNNNIDSSTNNTSFTIKDGMNLYFGKVVGKLILTIGLITLLLLPIILSFLLT